MHAAARGDSVQAAELLWKAGVSLEVLDSKGELTPLHSAALNGSFETAQWLLHHGANREGGCKPTKQTPLISAAMNGHTEVVRLLIQHSASINASQKLEVGSKTVTLNALSWAVTNGHVDTATLLREHGGLMPVEQPIVANEFSLESTSDKVLMHLESKCGRVLPQSLIEVVPSEFPIDLRVFESEGMDKVLTIATSGFSADVVLESGQHRARVELTMRLPGDWQLTQKAMDSPNYAWPFLWMRALARHFHVAPTGLRTAMVVSQEEIPRLVTPSMDFGGALIIRNVVEFDQLLLMDESVVWFYDVLPLYRAEIALASTQGIEELVRRLDENQISSVLNLGRTDVSSSNS